ncbi:MAG: hypothetical protein ACOCRK_11755 [bacterium]
MNNLAKINSKKEAQMILDQSDEVNESNVRLIVKKSLSKLNDIEKRINTIEERGFFKRMFGLVSGKNNKDMIAIVRDTTEASKLQINLILSLAIMHSKNQKILDEVLSELNESKGTYTRVSEHIEFLYEQIEKVKEESNVVSVYFKIKSSPNILWMSIFVFATLIIGLIIYLS